MNIKTKIIVRKDSRSNWIKYNPVLYQGEIGYDTTIKKCKIGDGISSWSDLPYMLLELDLQDKATVLMGTKESWNSNRMLISERGVLYLYVDYKIINENNEEKQVPGLKIGDGQSFLIDLPFITTYLQKDLANHINNTAIHVSQEDRVFWNNKITCFLDPMDNENLILTKERN